MNPPRADQLASPSSIQRRGSKMKNKPLKGKNRKPSQGNAMSTSGNSLNSIPSSAPKEKILMRVNLPSNASATVEIESCSNIQQLLEEICRKKRLSSAQHFIVATQDGAKFTPNSISLVGQLQMPEIELIEKSVIKFSLTKDDSGVHGFNVVGEDPDSRARGVFVLSINPSSTVASKGLLHVGDHILSVDGKNSSSMGFLEVCDNLRNKEVTLVVSTKRELCQDSIEYEKVDFDFEAAADHRTIFLTMGEVEGLGCKAVPSALVDAIDMTLLQNLILPLPEVTFDTHDKKIEAEIDIDKINLEDLLNKVTTLCNDCTSLILRPGQSGGKLTKRDVRTRVLLEILNTEQTYLGDLKEMLSIYVEPLKAKNLLNPEEQDIVASNTKDLIEFHTEFLKDLEPSVDFEIDPPAEIDPDMIPLSTASCFVQHMNKFSMYSDYCRVFPDASAVVEGKKNDANFAMFLREKNPENEQSKSIDSYLIKPVQRILKYPLLLRELHKYTGKDIGGNIDEVEQALDMFKAVAADINEIKREADNALKAKEIIKALEWGDYESVPNCGNLLYFGELFLLVEKNKNNEKLECYLFQKELLLCKNLSTDKKKNKDGFTHRVIDHFPVQAMIARDKHSEEGKFIWQLVDGSSARSVLLECRVLEEKKKWLELTKIATRECIRQMNKT